jgi:hypothetical protein
LAPLLRQGRAPPHFGGPQLFSRHEHRSLCNRVDTPHPSRPIENGDLVLKGEYVSFLEATCLHESRPEANLEVTAAGRYPQLEEISPYTGTFMGEKARQEFPFCEAAAHWYDSVYLPVIEAIREYHLLKRFPHAQRPISISGLRTTRRAAVFAGLGNRH